MYEDQLAEQTLEELLEKIKQGYYISAERHPLGFVKIKISSSSSLKTINKEIFHTTRNELRLHIWPPGPKNYQFNVPHSHPWSFSSRVLRGSITQEIYEEINSKEVYDLYEVRYRNSTSNRCLVSKSAGYDIQSSRVYLPNDTYTLSSNTFHRVFTNNSSGYCVTLVYCDQDTGQTPKVLLKIKDETPSEFNYESINHESLASLCDSVAAEA